MFSQALSETLKSLKISFSGNLEREIQIHSMAELEYELDRFYGHDENTKKRIMMLIKHELKKRIQLIQENFASSKNMDYHENTSGGSEGESYKLVKNNEIAQQSSNFQNNHFSNDMTVALDSEV